MHINELENYFESNEPIPWFPPERMELNKRVAEQKLINEKYHHSSVDPAEKTETDDEAIADYVSVYLSALSRELDGADALKLLDSIYWVFTAFSSYYIVSICSASFSAAINRHAISGVRVRALELLAELEPPLSEHWQHMVDALDDEVQSRGSG